MNAAGTGLVYCGYIGGNSWDRGNAIAVDASGNAYVAGSTSSDQNTFLVTVGPDLTYNGGISNPKWDAFVSKVSLTVLQGSGTPRPGGTVSLMLTATNDAGLSFQLGTSLGTGPIQFDTRKLSPSPDNLLLVTVNNSWPLDLLRLPRRDRLDGPGTGRHPHPEHPGPDRREASFGLCDREPLSSFGDQVDLEYVLVLDYQVGHAGSSKGAGRSGIS